MNRITVINQQEFDILPQEFNIYAQIKIVGILEKIDRTPKNSYIIICNNAHIGRVYGSAHINRIYDSTVICEVLDYAVVERTSDNAIVVLDKKSKATVLEHK